MDVSVFFTEPLTQLDCQLMVEIKQSNTMHGPFTKSSFFYLSETNQLDFVMTGIARDSLKGFVQSFKLALQYLEEVSLSCY